MTGCPGNNGRRYLDRIATGLTMWGGGSPESLWEAAVMILDPDELEKAEELDKALEQLARGEEPQVADPEVKSLLEVARRRRRLAQELQEEAERHRQRVWELIQEKIRRRPQS